MHSNAQMPDYKSRLLKGLIVVLLVLTPLGIYCSLGLIQPRYFTIGLIALFVLRMITNYSQSKRSTGLIIWSIIMIVALLGIAIDDSTIALLLYPVVMSAGFLVLFMYSLLFPPSMIEQIARTHDPELPEAGVRYTRKVTIVWSAFFLFNGCIAAWTVLNGNYKLWGLYNGLISYLIMGVLIIAEYYTRGKVRRSFNNE